MRRLIYVLAILVAAIAPFAVLGMHGSSAQSPSLVGTWKVTEGGGQPSYLAVFTSDGSVIARTSNGVTYIGAWEEQDGAVIIDLSTLELRGGAQGFVVEGPVQELEEGRIVIGDSACTHCWVLRPYTVQRVDL